MRYPSKRNNNKGYTLIEIMIALVIFSIFVVGVYEVYVDVHATWVAEEMKAATQQAGRATLDYMQRDLLMAGYKSSQYTIDGVTKSTVKLAEDKVVLANQSTICFDRYMDAPVYSNRLIEYSYRSGVLKRYVYMYYNGGPSTLDNTFFKTNPQIISSNIASLKFQYYNENNAQYQDSDLTTDKLMVAQTATSGPPVIGKICVLVVQRSEKPDPKTHKYYYVTNDITVTPVNMLTTETSNSGGGPNIPTGLNVIDSKSCTNGLECKWNANTDNATYYTVYWSTDPNVTQANHFYEHNSLPIPATNSPSYTITQDSQGNPIQISKKYGTTIIYYVAVSASNTLGTSQPCNPVAGDPNPDISTFGGSNDTTVNVSAPTTSPTGFTAVDYGQNEVQLTWNSDSDAVQGYRIYRKTGAPFNNAVWPIYNNTSTVLIADEHKTYVPGSPSTGLQSGAKSFIDEDPALQTCQNYYYALCAINCDETLVADYTGTQFAMSFVAPTNTYTPAPPSIKGSMPGWKRIFINLTNPIRTGWNADFDYTMIYYSKGGPYPTVDLNKNDSTYGQVTGGTPIPNTDCGVPGMFTTSGSVPTDETIFADPNQAYPPAPDLDNGATYYLLAVSHYKCRGFTMATTCSQTLTQLCGDDPPGPPSMLDESGNIALKPWSGGGCVYSTYSTAAETVLPITLNWTYSLQNGALDINKTPVYDYGGVYIYRKNHGDPDSSYTYLTGPVWSGPVTDSGNSTTSLPAPTIGSVYDYAFRLGDCVYKNDNANYPYNITPIDTSDADYTYNSTAPHNYEPAAGTAQILSGISAGNVRPLKTVIKTFGTFTSVPNGIYYHNAVQFDIVNTANCNLTLTALDNITWNNQDAYLYEVIVGPSSDGKTTTYSQTLPVPGGSSLVLLKDGTYGRTASLNLTTPAILQAGINGQPSTPIPVTLVFVNSQGTVLDTTQSPYEAVDMRSYTISMNARYENDSTQETTCARNGTIPISLGPSVVGVVQNQPLSPTLAYPVKGNTGTNTAPNILVNGGPKVNVQNTTLSNTFVNNTSVAISSENLYYTTTTQDPTIQAPPSDSIWTSAPMLNIGTDTYSLLQGTTDNEIPDSEGERIWYYIVATDSQGNFSRAPSPQSGYYTYDQKAFSVCNETPDAPTNLQLSSISGTSAPYTVTLTWTAPTQYTDGSTIGARASDTLTYEVFAQSGIGAFTSVANNLTGTTWTGTISSSTEFEVVAKNSCTSPGPNVSADSNVLSVCADNTPMINIEKPVASLYTNWSNDTSTEYAVPFYVHVCSFIGYTGVATLPMTITSADGVETQTINLTNDGQTGNFYFGNKQDIYITAQGSLYGAGISGTQGATKITNLTDTITFSCGGGSTGLPAASATLPVVTDPSCNTPSQVQNAVPSGAGRYKTISWPAVTTNTDGSTINDLYNPGLGYQGYYKIYVRDNISGVISFVAEVNASSATTYSATLDSKSYSAGSTVYISAVDTVGNEGAMSAGQVFN